MSIANELSCDVAAALLAGQVNPRVLSEKTLTALVLEVHTTLRRLTDADRRRRRAHRPEVLPKPTSNGNAASGQ